MKRNRLERARKRERRTYESTIHLVAEAAEACGPFPRAPNDPEIDVEKYGAHWGAETGYRQVEDIGARSRSSSHGPRVMCMAFTLMLFNA